MSAIAAAFRFASALGLGITLLLAGAAQAATINFTPVRISVCYCSLAIDPDTGRFYESRSYSGDGRSVYVYADAAAFAADTYLDHVGLYPRGFDGTYTLVHLGEIYGRMDNFSTATSTWSLTTGDTTSSSNGYAGMGGNNGIETFDWGGYSGVNFMQDSTGRYVVGAVTSSSNWQIEKLGVGLNSVSTTVFTPSTSILGWAFIINGTLFTGATFSTNIVTGAVDVNTGAVSAVSHILSGLGGSHYFTNFSYDFASDTLYAFNGNTLTWYAAANASTQFGIAAICAWTTGNDICLIQSTTNPLTGINALAGTDTLQVGGAVNFNFNAAGVDTTYTNFEVFQKVGLSNVTLTGTAGVATNWDILAGTLTAAGGNAIFNSSTVNVGGAGTFAVGASEMIGKLTGSGSTSIAAGQTLTTGDASNHSYSGTTSGLGGLTKAGSGKFSTLSLGHTGLTTIAAGELNTNGTIGGSVQINAGATLSGNNTIVGGSVQINAGATLSGNSTIGGNLTNLGTLKPGNSPGTTTVVGNYIGGGVMNVDVQFNDAVAASSAVNNGITHDFLTVGGSATGATTLLNIIAFPPSGAPAATGNGIELVRIGGANAPGQFALSARVFQGAYEYTLAYVPTAGADSYFLQSRLGETIFADAAMFSAGQAMTGACFRGTDELVGGGTRDSKGRGWAKVSTGNRSTGPDTGIDSEQDFNCGSGGVDVRIAGSMRAGISGGYGNTDVDVQTLDGVGKLDGDGGMIQGFLGYAHEHLFANLSLGYGNINWNFDSPLTAPVTATTGGVIGSLQAGMLWPMGDWRLGAMAELGYDDMTCGDQCLLAGTVEDINNWSVKGTVRLDGSMHGGDIMPFLAVSLSDGGSNTVTNGSAIITTDTASSIFNAKAGITAMVAENTAFFIDASLTEGMSTDVSGVDGTAGVKLFW